jgi:UDP-N-acetylmuramyl tripeptide synthase
MKTYAGDGRNYIQQAIENGAAAIVQEANYEANAFVSSVPVIQIANLDKICGKNSCLLV